MPGLALVHERHGGVRMEKAQRRRARFPRSKSARRTKMSMSAAWRNPGCSWSRWPGCHALEGEELHTCHVERGTDLDEHAFPPQTADRETVSDAPTFDRKPSLTESSAAIDRAAELRNQAVIRKPRREDAPRRVRRSQSAPNRRTRREGSGRSRRRWGTRPARDRRTRAPRCPNGAVAPMLLEAVRSGSDSKAESGSVSERNRNGRLEG